MDRVKGPKMAGFPARMENSGKIVDAPRMGGIADYEQKSYMSKSQADYDKDLARVKKHMCKESM